MKIGIDISQLAFENTGVANYLLNLVQNLIRLDRRNQYILFYSSMRKNLNSQIVNFKSNPNVSIKQFKIPPTVLNIMWNKLHIAPIEWFIGDVDVFITSDWTEPPTKKAKKATIIYDLVILKHPEETDQKIVSVQKRKLNWVKKESDIAFCISKSSRNDAIDILGLDPDKVKVIYPGV